MSTSGPLPLDASDTPVLPARGADATRPDRAGAALAAAVAVPLILFAAALALRGMSFVPRVIDTDEGLFIVQAREWLRGGWPLVAVWDMHPVGAPALMALALTVFGETIAGVRLFGALSAALAGWGVYGAARAARAPRGLALGAGLLYVAHTTLLGGLTTNTEVMFAPFVAAAMALGIRGAVRALEDGTAPRWSELLAMGLLIGVALTVKPVVAPEGSLAFLFLVLPAFWRGVLPLRRAIGFALAYAALCALPTALLALAYALRSAFWEFLDGSFLAPLRYSGGRLGPVAAFWEIATAVLILAWPLGLALFAALWRRGAAPPAERRLLGFGALWFAAATLAIVGPGMFFNHYFLIWLPPLSVLAACGAWRLAGAIAPPAAPPRRAGLLFAGIVAVLAADAWLGDAVPRMQRGIGLREHDPARDVATALAAAVPPGAPVLIANYHPAVYALARVGLTSRYAFPPHLTGRYGPVAGIDMDAELARALATRPAAIVVDRGWWTMMRPTAAAMITAALEADYTRVASVQEDRGPVEIWRRRLSPAAD